MGDKPKVPCDPTACVDHKALEVRVVACEHMKDTVEGIFSRLRIIEGKLSLWRGVIIGIAVGTGATLPSILGKLMDFWGTK